MFPTCVVNLAECPALHKDSGKGSVLIVSNSIVINSIQRKALTYLWQVTQSLEGRVGVGKVPLEKAADSS